MSKIYNNFVNFQKFIESYFPAFFMNMYLWIELLYGYLVFLILKVLGMTNLQYEIQKYLQKKLHIKVTMTMSMLSKYFLNQTLFICRIHFQINWLFILKNQSILTLLSKFSIGSKPLFINHWLLYGFLLYSYLLLKLKIEP